MPSQPSASQAAAAARRRGGLSVRALALAGLAAIALAWVAILTVHVGSGAHVAFLLGGTGNGNAAQLGPLVGHLNAMAIPVAVVAGAVAVLGFLGGAILLMAGHPHAARHLSRVALGAIIVSTATAIVH